MADFYLQNEYWFAVFQLVFAMLGMGATLTIGSFRQIIAEPKAVATGSLIQLLIVPLVVFLFISGFGVAGGVAVGMAIIAAIPGGTTSNIFTHFARGNISLSIAITALTTLVCLFTTPVILDLFVGQYVPQNFEMPRGQIMSEIALTLLLPLIMGMAYLRLFPGSAEAFSKYCIRLSLIGILLIVLGASSSGRLDMDAFGVTNLLLILLLIVTLGIISALACKAMGLVSYDTTAINIEVTVRNVNLGLVLKAILFPAILGKADTTGDLVLFSLLAFGSAQLVLSGVYIYLRRRKILS